MLLGSAHYLLESMSIHGSLQTHAAVTISSSQLASLFFDINTTVASVCIDSIVNAILVFGNDEFVGQSSSVTFDRSLRLSMTHFLIIILPYPGAQWR